MTLLSVNVNKLATLRNSRGGQTPNVAQCAHDILTFGAHGITVHPRPDGRHIRTHDVFELRNLTQNFKSQGRDAVEFNIEGYPAEDFMQMIEKVRPEQCTLVPDPPEAITSNAGWKVHENYDFLGSILERLRRAKVRSSIFVDPFAWNEREQKALVELHPDRIELYTERYATHFSLPDRDAVTARYRALATQALGADIGLNAGHDLNLSNIRHLVQAIPQLAEVSIGHALISEALYLGFKETIRRYLHEMSLEMA